MICVIYRKSIKLTASNRTLRSATLKRSFCNCWAPSSFICDLLFSISSSDCFMDDVTSDSCFPISSFRAWNHIWTILLTRTPSKLYDLILNFLNDHKYTILYCWMLYNFVTRVGIGGNNTLVHQWASQSWLLSYLQSCCELVLRITRFITKLSFGQIKYTQNILDEFITSGIILRFVKLGPNIFIISSMYLLGELTKFHKKIQFSHVGMVMHANELNCTWAEPWPHS